MQSKNHAFVNVSNDLRHPTLQFLRIQQSGRGDLNGNDLSCSLWVVLQELFEGSQLRAE